ncbi:IMC sub-compartment protein ISP3 [Toxoplasma gondii TgCatPRC2]|uniref:IMC sub-compartment protein ISP3 n=15 Tax=Toxoplasma gondii TaxID=5811 RepID=B9PJE6_TOXGV|nr:IMC sub-compartment protein ISP3 [Toxoplasma gondii ME49]ADV15617.1 inner membrane complex sub-compartment protein 3 [Toxoplasma gondii]EPR58782.1 IMC sub-compartment protein ISP3 [Toxoplasma gondii GT1]ESS35251.1 IMC sub-compartment protein ISP3 [Toxoplasma gondii VEG]KFG28785.1 IMC sub-compartment protein ISP3 [Toxoplasma gondii GAB2-2007-GAL-DOM2]KFG49265.1 IMC sub-compartment protein ISP3 [Toxoplasma gondii p89]KFG56451.1 IMC sub-compartment protein ISP3 [Toxoplasma gondii FOU]KFG6645|eukprot:XP_018635288.1 IMC sub-compartment protein ISP3 [Toxoplasma gondii ME49]
MGNTACCGFDSDSTADLEIGREGEVRSRKPIQVSKEAFDNWMNRYEAGDTMEVLFPDGHRIECNLKIDRPKNFMNLTFNQKVRPIQLDDIAAVLYGSDPRSSECADSKMLRNPCVVGFRLASSGRAIAFSFKDITDAQCFVSFLDDEIKKNQESNKSSASNDRN